MMYQCTISLVLGCSWMFLAFIDLIGYVCGGPAPKKRTANSTSSGYGRVSTGSAGSMSAPGLRSGKLEVRKEKSEKSERTPGDRRQKFETKQNKSYYCIASQFVHCEETHDDPCSDLVFQGFTQTDCMAVHLKCQE